MTVDEHFDTYWSVTDGRTDGQAVALAAEKSTSKLHHILVIVNLSYACSTETAIDYCMYVSELCLSFLVFILCYLLFTFVISCLCQVFTARCTLVQSAVLRSHVVCLSVCNVGGL